MVDVIGAFFIIGAIIFTGFLGMLFFERTKIPDILLLILIGMLIGPIFRLIEPEPLYALVPFFASLALIILLFDGGMNMNFYKVLGELSKASLFTLMAFVFTTLFVASIVSFLFNWNLLLGLLLGGIVGGTSSAIVIPLLNKVSGSEENKMILRLESALTDALCVVVAITLVQIILSQEPSISTSLNALLGAFSIATVIGLIAGILWMRVLKQLQEQQFNYLLTLATIFILYGFVETVKANGAIATLVFGIVLGNADEIAKIFRMHGTYKISETIKHFQIEVSFFVRTFFFVYLGLLFNPKIIELNLLLITLAVLVAVLAARVWAVKLFTLRKPEPRTKMLLTVIMPRGLAAAVLATFPSSYGVEMPEMNYFTGIVLLVILFTNIFTTIGVFLYEKSQLAYKEKPKIVKIKSNTS